MAGRERGYPRPNYYIAQNPTSYAGPNNNPCNNYHHPANYHYHYPAINRSADNSRLHRRRQSPSPQPPDLLDKMFASASASLTALCLSLRAIDGHPVTSGRFNVQLAKNAASSQATACIDWIKAMSSSNNDVINPNNQTLHGGNEGMHDRINNNSMHNINAQKDAESVDAHEINGCKEKELIVVEQPRDSTFSLVEKPLEIDLELIDSCEDSDKPRSRWFNSSHAKKLINKNGASVKGTKRTITSPILYTHAKSNSACASTKEPCIAPLVDTRAKTLTLQENGLKDSDFLFDADFEAFLP